VLLSQHRFADAIKQAQSLQARDPRDAWNYGAMGDGYLELGDYDRAFAAFDRMGQLQPGPSVYARVAYALELKGDLTGALESMKQASDGTTPNDAEAQAWHFAQLGSLLLQQGRAGEARLQFERAAATFPNHPLAIAGLARVKAFEKDFSAARLLCQQLLAQAPTPDMAALIGDLSRELGDADGAEQYYRMSEQIERAAWSNGPRQPQNLARLFADHDRNIPEAIALAEEALQTRNDIFTDDTAAWAYFKAGRLEDARRWSKQALRTGTRDARILSHAAAIDAGLSATAKAVALH
jgi:tetratricopeptide (TPR) repeat protein